MIDRHRLKWVWILMINSCSRVLHQLQRQIFLWDRFFPCTTEASHLYLGHCFFLRGGTLFNIHRSTSSSEQSLFSILLLRGGAYSVSLPLIFLYCIYWMYVIMGGLDYSINPCILFSSLFLGEFFSHVVFPSFHALWEICIHYVHGYLKWPHRRDPSSIHPSIRKLKCIPLSCT